MLTTATMYLLWLLFWLVNVFDISCISICDDSTQILRFTASFKSSILMTYFCWRKKKKDAMRSDWYNGEIFHRVRWLKF